MMVVPQVELFQWTEKHVGQLVALYKERPCLYNNKSKEYSKRNVCSTVMKELQQLWTPQVGCSRHRGYKVWQFYVKTISFTTINCYIIYLVQIPVLQLPF